MKLKHACYTGLVMLLIGQGAVAAEDLTYKNTRGSILKLQINEDNTLAGSFTSAVASKDCQKAIGVKRPITGVIEKNTLAFAVSYPGCGVVSFIGKVEDKQNKLDTTAIIAHSSALAGKGDMNAHMISHDVFSRQE